MTNGVGHQRLSQSSAGGQKSEFVPVKPRPSHGWAVVFGIHFHHEVSHGVCGVTPVLIAGQTLNMKEEGGETTEYRKPGECRVL